MMLTRRVKHIKREAQKMCDDLILQKRDSGILSHLTRATLPLMVYTAVLGNSLEVTLSLGHCSIRCFSSPSKPRIRKQKKAKQDFKATEGVCFGDNFVNKQTNKNQLIGKV